MNFYIQLSLLFISLYSQNIFFYIETEVADRATHKHTDTHAALFTVLDFTSVQNCTKTGLVTCAKALCKQNMHSQLHVQRIAFFSKQRQSLQFLMVPVHECYIVFPEGYIWFIRVKFGSLKNHFSYTCISNIRVKRSAIV